LFSVKNKVKVVVYYRQTYTVNVIILLMNSDFCYTKYPKCLYLAVFSVNKGIQALCFQWRIG